MAPRLCSLFYLLTLNPRRRRQQRKTTARRAANQQDSAANTPRLPLELLFEILRQRLSADFSAWAEAQSHAVDANRSLECGYYLSSGLVSEIAPQTPSPSYNFIRCRQRSYVRSVIYSAGVNVAFRTEVSKIVGLHMQAAGRYESRCRMDLLRETQPCRHGTHIPRDWMDLYRVFALLVTWRQAAMRKGVLDSVALKLALVRLEGIHVDDDGSSECNTITDMNKVRK